VRELKDFSASDVNDENLFNNEILTKICMREGVMWKKIMIVFFQLLDELPMIYGTCAMLYCM